MEGIKIPLSKGRGHALISPEDCDKISQHKWYLSNTGYVTCTGSINGKRNMLMHKAIIKTPKGTEIDHVNRNKVDNRRENLRIATRKENRQNAEGHRDGLKGVFQRRHNKFDANIGIDNKTEFLGSYKTEEDAALAYDSAALYYFKEFAKTNYPGKDTTPHSIKELRDMNKKPTSSQYGGVSFQTSRGKWRARIKIKGKEKHLGLFDNEEDAARAYNEAVIKYRGD